MDCLRYYCTNCLTRCGDRRLNCDKCCILGQRPLIRSTLLEMRSKDLQHYLNAKKISTRGCVEKEDLVNLVILHANATSSNQRTGSSFEDGPFMNAFRGFTSNIFNTSTSNVPNWNRSESRRTDTPPRDRAPDGPRDYPRQPQRSNESNISSSADHSNSTPNSRSRSRSNSNDRQARLNAQTVNAEPTPIASSPETERASSFTESPHNIEIEEVSDSDCSQPPGPEPLVTEQDENTSADAEKHSVIVTELLSHTGTVKLSDIDNIAGLQALNVKQLKDLLSINRVNFKGCVERSELLDRASRLWQQHAKSREDLEKLGLDDLCKICMDAPVECVMLECGHMATCTTCGKQLSECPICRQYVVRVVRTFRA
ncbi:E3 ubiquitin-protein ligase rififylin isoform X2 [Athalia rosae]|nr:E3 ubiquitin-protein ligase rififylin isoform X2 [Athalia rosae]